MTSEEHIRYEYEIWKRNPNSTQFGDGVFRRIHVLLDAIDSERAENAKLKKDFLAWVEKDKALGREFIEGIEDPNAGIILDPRETQELCGRIGALIQQRDKNFEHIQLLLGVVEKWKENFLELLNQNEKLKKILNDSFAQTDELLQLLCQKNEAKP